MSQTLLQAKCKWLPFAVGGPIFKGGPSKYTYPPLWMIIQGCINGRYYTSVQHTFSTLDGFTTNDLSCCNGKLIINLGLQANVWSEVITTTVVRLITQAIPISTLITQSKTPGSFHSWIVDSRSYYIPAGDICFT